MAKIIRTVVCALVLATLVFTLSGCDAIVNNGRATLTSERIAQSYIHAKYGIDADPLGHVVQDTGSYPVNHIRSDVVVPMSYEGKTFCVYLDMDDASCRYDNYQKDVVAAVLEDYLLDNCKLPKAAYSNIKFDLESRPSIGDNVFLEDVGWSDTVSHSFDSSSMLDFRYDGQSAEELLDAMSSIEYKAAFSDTDKLLGSMTVPYDLAESSDTDIHMSLWNYEDPAVLEENVIDRKHLQGFHCADMDPTDVAEGIRHGADEVRFYYVSLWQVDDGGEPEVTDSYADCTP